MDWRVEDFKGIIRCDLDLTPGTTTILTGKNSSGKTSLLQSLLLLRQSGQGGDGIVLNGPLVRLGKAADLLRQGAGESTAKFHIAVDAGTYNFALTASTERRPTTDTRDDPDPHASEMHLKHLTVVSNRDEKQPDLQLSTDRSIRKDVELIKDRPRTSQNVAVLHLKADGVRFSARRYARSYLVFNGLRCEEIVKIYPPDVFKRKLVKQLKSFVEQYFSIVDENQRTRTDSVKYGYRYVVKALANDFADHLHTLDTDASSRKRRSSSGPAIFRTRAREEQLVYGLRRLSSRQIDALIETVANERSENPVVSTKVNPWTSPVRFPSGIDEKAGSLEMELTEQFRDILREVETFSDLCEGISRRIQYIGPLRDEPRVVWSQWNSETPGLPVGSRGELTANYYAKKEKTIITYSPPPVNGQRQSDTKGSLSEAVQQWIQYLRIGTQISSRGFGKIGVGLEVTWNGKKRDLTSLGVGVSQALPIVIAGLAAQSNSIFIVEQPELHLHPDVQARLADFFIYSRPDLNYVIETHSEALITRVRRRVAEGGFDKSDVHLTFIEPKALRRGRKFLGYGAVSRNIQFTEMGDLSEWPDGFISGSLSDTRAIMAATVARLSNGDATQ